MEALACLAAQHPGLDQASQQRRRGVVGFPELLVEGFRDGGDQRDGELDRQDAGRQGVATSSVIRRPGRPYWRTPPSTSSGLALVYADRLDRASVWSGRLLQEATARRVPTWQARLTVIRTELALRQGDLNEAYALAQSAMTHLSPRSWGVAVGAPLSTLVLAATAMGADDVAEEHLRHSVPEAIFQSRYGLQYLYARGHHHLAANRVHMALDDFLRCGDQARAWDMDLPALLPWRGGCPSASGTAGPGSPARGGGTRPPRQRQVPQPWRRPVPARRDRRAAPPNESAAGGRRRPAAGRGQAGTRPGTGRAEFRAEGDR